MLRCHVKPKHVHSFSIVWFKTEEEVVKAVRELNGKNVDGSVLLVKSFSENHPNLEEPQRTCIAKDDILPG